MIKNILDLLPLVKGETEIIRIAKGKKIYGEYGGRRPLNAPKDRTRAELYEIAKQIKKRDGHNFPISTFNKYQLKRYVLKYE